MEFNELFMSPPPPPHASDYDDLSPPFTFPLMMPPQLHIDSSSSSSSSTSFFPSLHFTPHFHLDGRGLDLDSVLGPLSSHSSATTSPVPTLPWNPLLEHKSTPHPRNRDSHNCRDKSSTDGSSVSEQLPEKRRCLDRGKPKGPSKFAERGDASVVTTTTTKRSREDEEVVEGDGIGPARQPTLGIGAEEEEEDEGRKKKSKKEKKGGGGDDGLEPPKDYIHVRARRGQATDSHSLAERVREFLNFQSS